MTFNFAPYAVDGARTPAARARAAVYTTGGGRSGITKPSDLQVLPLSVPGNGLRITSGSASIINGYQTNPNETYVVSNPGIHTVLSGSMPAPVPQVAHYMVVVAVGDQEFSQVGHPFMPSTPLDAEVALDFEYVRVVIVPCPAGATTFEQLNLDYPGYGLARLEVPANTSTITGAMITDLRSLAQPRSQRDTDVVLPVQGNNLTSGSYTAWPLWSDHTVPVPAWATKVTILAHLNGFHAVGNSDGALRFVLTGLVGGPETIYDIDNVGATRENFMVTYSGPIGHLAGQNLAIALQGLRNNGPGHLSTVTGGQVIFDIQFDEQPI